MPEEDVSDLQDVFDAINKLCETMRTSTYEEAEAELVEEPLVIDKVEELVEIVDSAEIMRIVEREEKLASPTEVAVRIVDAYRAERWSDALVSPPGEDDTELAFATVEPVSEMYYTASSEISLISDGEVPDKPTVDENVPQEQEKDDKESRQECVIAGHVAAMRERFESMTRENTPCPDLDARNITPSPDLLG